MNHSIELKHTFDLYADNIRVYNSNTSEEFNKQLIYEMLNRQTLTTSRCRSSFKDSIDRTMKQDLTEIFNNVLVTYIKELYDSDIFENFEFYQDWSVSIHRNERALLPHTHNETFVTMCYYPKAPMGLPQYTLSSPLIPFKTGEIVLNNSDGFSLPGRFAKDKTRLYFHYLPQEGDVIIFPGHVPHWVVGGELEDRYSLASFISIKPNRSELMELNWK